MSTGCLHEGYKQLILYLNGLVLGAYRCPGQSGPPCDPNQGQLIVQQFINALDTIRCKLPDDIKNQLIIAAENISNESTNTIIKINLLYIIVIFVTLLILIILIYLTIYLNDYILLFSIISIVIIIIAALILLFGINMIYKNSSNAIKIQRDIIVTILTQIVDAGESGLSCLANDPSCPCVTC